jgi:hypothetical protein
MLLRAATVLNLIRGPTSVVKYRRISLVHAHTHFSQKTCCTNLVTVVVRSEMYRAPASALDHAVSVKPRRAYNTVFLQQADVLQAGSSHRLQYGQPGGAQWNDIIHHYFLRSPFTS